MVTDAVSGNFENSFVTERFRLASSKFLDAIYGIHIRLQLSATLIDGSSHLFKFVWPGQRSDLFNDIVCDHLAVLKINF